MLNFTAGDDVTLIIPFTQDGEFVVPDANSVSYSVRDNTGALISGLINVAVTTSGDTEAPITVTGGYNTKSLMTEVRTVIAKYTVNAHPFEVIIPYRLHDWLNFAVGADEVRKQLGLSRTELPDEDVDLFDAYYLLDVQVTAMTGASNVLATALSSGTINAKYANDALVYKAAFDLMPSLPARVLQKEQAATVSYQRYGRFDFEELHDKIAGLLEDALTNLTGVKSTFPPILVGGKRRDVITGV